MVLKEQPDKFPKPLSILNNKHGHQKITPLMKTHDVGERGRYNIIIHVYCKTGNFRLRLIFANFAIVIKINIREYICLVL